MRYPSAEADPGTAVFVDLLRTIAASLAEHNELFRSEQERQIKLAEEVREREAERMKLFGGMKDTQDVIAGTIAKPPARPPLTPQGPVVIHRGCILEDGDRIILAMEDGPIELSKEDQARIRAIITPVSESKPQ
jgi:hypothetical protein